MGDNNYKRMKQRNLDELAENKCDSASASSVNEDMQRKYQLELADLCNE